VTTSGRTGAALLEVLVALAILFAAGAAATGAVQAALASEGRSVRVETELADADRLLTALTLLTRSDLDLRLGERTIGDWRLEILRPGAGLYRIALARADAGPVPLLVTLIHRPAPTER
jgi:hypothetical protein